MRTELRVNEPMAPGTREEPDESRMDRPGCPGSGGAPRGRQPDRAISQDRFRRPLQEKGMLQEDRGSNVNNGQPGPVEHLLGKPVLAMLRRVGRFGQTHLRNGHLRNIDEHIQIRPLSRHSGRDDCRLQVGRGNAHAEKHPVAPLDGPCHIRGAGQVTNHDFCACGPQCCGSVHHRSGPGHEPADLADGAVSPQFGRFRPLDRRHQSPGLDSQTSFRSCRGLMHRRRLTIEYRQANPVLRENATG